MSRHQTISPLPHLLVQHPRLEERILKIFELKCRPRIGKPPIETSVQLIYRVDGLDKEKSYDRRSSSWLFAFFEASDSRNLEIVRANFFYMICQRLAVWKCIAKFLDGPAEPGFPAAGTQAKQRHSSVLQKWAG